MRHLILGALLALATSPALRAQDDKEKPKPDKPASAEKEFSDLKADYNKAQAELSKPLEGVKTPE